MTNDDVRQIVGNTPHMSLDQANRLTRLMAEHDLRDVLELGFAHGVSTCYIAAALARSGGGKVVTIDLDSARQRQPSIEQLLELIGERQRVTIFFEPISYTWRLMKLIEEDPRPRFDLCYLDGAHSWYVDALAFFLVDLLLHPGGWIVFDDLDWTHASSSTIATTDMFRRMSPDEKTLPHIRKIYELLVRSHPHYHNFRVEHGWAYAQKKESVAGELREREVVAETIVHVQKEYVGIGSLLMRSAKKLSRK